MSFYIYNFKVRTVFNLLGPLVNPFQPNYQVLGVARSELLDPMGADKGKHNRPYFDYKKVNQKVYAYYMQYLENRERIFLTRARRALMEII